MSLLPKLSISQISVSADQIAECSYLHFMIINTKKTKQMLFGPMLQNPLPSIVLDTGTVGRVTSIKLLGVTITDNLIWENHINSVCAIACSRLNFLKLLERLSVTHNDLLLYYASVHWPDIEYACPVWQSGSKVK
jgi:hypothetical protein